MRNPLLTTIEQPVNKSGAVPLVTEVPVNPHLDAILTSHVSKSISLYWFERPLPGGLVRAGVRPPGDISAFFRLVVEAVAERGRELEYGNTHPYNLKGLRSAGDYVASFDLPDVHILVHPKGGKRYLKRGTVGDYPVEPADWLAEDTAVALPKNRAYVGDLYTFPSGAFYAVVHNAVRGLAVVKKKKRSSK